MLTEIADAQDCVCQWCLAGRRPRGAPWENPWRCRRNRNANGWFLTFLRAEGVPWHIEVVRIYPNLIEGAHGSTRCDGLSVDIYCMLHAILMGTCLASNPDTVCTSTCAVKTNSADMHRHQQTAEKAAASKGCSCCLENINRYVRSTVSTGWNLHNDDYVTSV